MAYFEQPVSVSSPLPQSSNSYCTQIAPDAGYRKQMHTYFLMLCTVFWFWKTCLRKN